MADARALKVSELITLLQKCDPDLAVWSEGCDCVDQAQGVVVYRNEEKGHHYVMVARRLRRNLVWNGGSSRVVE